jgi:hypothetical protein
MGGVIRAWISHGNLVTINLAKPFKGAAEVIVQGTLTVTNGASSSVSSVKTL